MAWGVGPYYICQGILKGEASLYHWPPVWLVWNQLYGNWQFLFLFAKEINPNQSNRRSVVHTSPFSIPCILPESVAFTSIKSETAKGKAKAKDERKIINHCKNSIYFSFFCRVSRFFVSQTVLYQQKKKFTVVKRSCRGRKSSARAFTLHSLFITLKVFGTVSHLTPWASTIKLFTAASQ